MALRTINNEVKRHSLASCDHVILVCNTAHLLADGIVAETNINLSSLIEQVRSDVQKRGVKRLGLVASPTSIEAELFKFKGVELIAPTPTQTKILKRIIGEVIDGSDPRLHAKELKGIISTLLIRGATDVLLGCTELELVMRDTENKRFIKPLEQTISSLFQNNPQSGE